MRAVVEREPARLEVWVWLIQDSLPAGSAVFYPAPLGDLEQPGPSIKLIPQGTNLRQMEPTFKLPVEAFEALIAAGAEHLPPDRAQAHHLHDATAVRDRLLAIIESWALP